MEKQKFKVSALDIQMAVAIGSCVILSYFIPYLQVMTACIAVLLCTQGDLPASWKAGVTRIIITLVGGLTAVLVVGISQLFPDRWLVVLLTMAGVLLTFLGCKLSGVPAFSNRIGAVTFILVVFTKGGADRIPFALQRLVSTLAGVLIVTFVVFVWNLLRKAVVEKISSAKI
ncbi:FUSC family protein [Diplocloster modestus]|uniref:FUSC family protein n=1 Tax=Diplocloster modestus TaxID=2850322 RepID=A0ABS6KB39_9FIRM|nr:FUSC family protein [Diplocloster modestus]